MSNEEEEPLLRRLDPLHKPKPAARRQLLVPASLEDDLIRPEISTGETLHGGLFSWQKLLAFLGPGFLISIAYLDPGNLLAGLDAAVVSEYRLLWLLFFAHGTGLGIQLLAARLGTAQPGLHLASAMVKTFPRPVTWVIYVLAELAIIGSDVQAIVGTAIALQVLCGAPLWLGSLATALISAVVLVVPGFRTLEYCLLFLIGVMSVTLIGEMFAIAEKRDLGPILRGLLVPRVPAGAVLQAVGISGSVLMAQSLYLHSKAVHSRHIPRTLERIREANKYFAIEAALALSVSFIINLAVVVVFAKVFYPLAPGEPSPGLYEASAALERMAGRFGKFLWAVGLLAAGQSSTISGSLTGSIVMEGFLGKVFAKPIYRLGVTRSIALVPSLTVAIFYSDQMNDLGQVLNLLQSMILPAAVIPLLRLTYNAALMGPFRSRLIWNLLAWTASLFVITINLYLLVVGLQDTPPLLTAVGTLGVGLYCVLLLYLTLTPLDTSQCTPPVPSAP